MVEPKLLLADDDPALAGFMASAARSCGYNVIVTQTASSFQDAYCREKPDLLSIDLCMPGGDGVEVLRFLARQNCKTPVIIVSGLDRRVLQSAVGLGTELGLTMVAQFKKPVRLKDLREVLLAQVARKSEDSQRDARQPR